MAQIFDGPKNEYSIITNTQAKSGQRLGAAFVLFCADVDFQLSRCE
jgi:hypothetical protein